uniref:Uncharacterized protein n=1 Tax=Arundo donax TaxID=35708 RepID=A0A0A8Y854_ARUDO
MAEQAGSRMLWTATAVERTMTRWCARRRHGSKGRKGGGSERAMTRWRRNEP